ncbi:MAG: DNA cytosine methyltransferase [Thermoplasmatales archaeon]|nr:DNA cytosine methyltransferase [Thermoplasmatales archaeon]
MSEPLTFIDLFAGAGGFSLGLHQAGLAGIFAVERNEMAFSTLRHNLIETENAFDWPEWLPKEQIDIRFFLERYQTELSRLKGKVDLIVGGPPCQGFSMAGRRVEHDERNSLFQDYVKFVKLVEPSIIMFENVPGFSFPFGKNEQNDIPYSIKLSRELVNIGYQQPEQSIYNFSHFGVPQSRKRLVIIGSKKDLEPESIHEKIAMNGSQSTKITVGNAISDLRRVNGEIDSPDSRGFRAGIYGSPTSQYQVELRKHTINKSPDSHRFANHSERIVERFSEIVKSSSCATNSSKDYITSLKLKKRNLNNLDPNQPSPTLTTLPDDYIHYDEPRILTVREYARLQAFPDWFEFKGKYTTGGKLRVVETPRYTQVANAVPPKFAKIAGKVLRKYYS